MVVPYLYNANYTIEWNTCRDPQLYNTAHISRKPSRLFLCTSILCCFSIEREDHQSPTFQRFAKIWYLSMWVCSWALARFLFFVQCVVPENIHTPHGGFFPVWPPTPLAFSVPEGFALLPSPPGISMIFPLAPPYPLEIPNPKKEPSFILIDLEL